MNILIAVDLTDEDAEDFVRQAGTWAGALAKKADLVFVDEATDEHPYIVDATLRTSMSAAYEAWHTRMRGKLDRLVDSIPAGARGEPVYVRGQAVPALLELLEDYDGIVLGNRPTSGLARLVHGVVAERVARASSKPVVILPRR